MFQKLLLSLLLILIIVSTVLNSVSSQNISNLKHGEFRYKLQYKGTIREYLVYIPSKTDSSKPIPVIFNFHGGGANAKLNARFTSMNKTSEKYGFIVVYPEGVPSLLFDKMRTWNAGRCCGRAKRINSDDVGFTKAIIDDINRRFNIDNKRIYATGMSNGAMMSYKLACELSDKIAAIAPVAGTDNIKNCTPSRAVPIMHFHGTSDDFCRYDGGIGSKSFSKGNFNSVTYTIDKWKKINGCSESSVITFQNKNATCKTFNNCKDSSEVILCTIKDMGHTWPGGSKNSRRFLGNYSDDISANEEMWKFFLRHPMD